MIIVAVILLTLLTALVVWFFTAGPRLPKKTDAIINQVLNSDLPELIVGKTGAVTSDGLKYGMSASLPKVCRKGLFCLSWEPEAVPWNGHKNS